ncbi:Uncharacterized protein TCM_012953 [Theobroma cacao]|uniref:Uncharacterized protein n=1 Tax=Theobroma cacao TaxID=3641 RepID=A0A061FVZ6_THECC|nr:Uncharacterized protein TCM_012953 [Theobroma cacao]
MGRRKIKACLLPYENLLILSFPLSIRRLDDLQIQFNSKHDDYTVRLRYRILCCTLWGLNEASSSIHAVLT